MIVAGAAEDAPHDISQEQILAEIDLLVEAGSKKIRPSRKWPRNMAGTRASSMRCIMKIRIDRSSEISQYNQLSV